MYYHNNGGDDIYAKGALFVNVIIVFCLIQFKDENWMEHTKIPTSNGADATQQFLPSST